MRCPLAGFAESRTRQSERGLLSSQPPANGSALASRRLSLRCPATKSYFSHRTSLFDQSQRLRLRLVRFPK